MKNVLQLFMVLAVCALILLSFSLPATASTEQSDKAIASRTKDVDGLQFHYLTAGHGPTVILLHGYAETSRMWRPIMPILAERFTVIAPDLPGIGDSAIPENGLDMKTSAMRVHALARSLGGESLKAFDLNRRRVRKVTPSPCPEFTPPTHVILFKHLSAQIRRRRTVSTNALSA